MQTDLVAVGVGSDSTIPALFVGIVSVILVASWVILATSRFIRGGSLERPERVPQLYGYTVCLVALLVAFASVVSIVDWSLTLADPAQPRNELINWAEPSVTSFEAFRLSYDRSRQLSGGPNVPAAEQLSEDELRSRFEGLRADRIERTRVAAQRSLVKSSFTLLVAAVLFAIHWRWLRRRVEAGMLPGESSAT